eukprot:4520448-Pleurochrysis_carterae.AAC.2
MSVSSVTRAYPGSRRRRWRMNRKTGLRALRLASTCGVASASLSRSVRWADARTSAKAMALNPVARSSRAEMCSHRRWTGSSSQYQNSPWQ